MEFTKENGEKISTSGRQSIGGPLVLVLWVAICLSMLVCYITLSPVANVTEKLRPHATIEMDEWFADTAAQIYKLQRQIVIYEHFMKEMCDSYGGERTFPAISSWKENDREQFTMWNDELLEIKRKHDKLSREFNAKMTTANWELISGLEKAQASVKKIPPQFTVYDVPPSTSNMPSNWWVR